MSTINLHPGNYRATYDLLIGEQTSVTCLCASWCHVCNDFRAIFDATAGWNDQQIFLWIDIEDESGLIDDLDIESFPVLMIEDANGVKFFGPIEPNSSTIRMLVDTSVRDRSDESDAIRTKKDYPDGIRQRLASILMPAVQ